MTKDNSVNFEYHKSKLIKKTDMIPNISNNLPSIIKGTIEQTKDGYLYNISEVLTVYFECLRTDGFLPNSTKYDEEMLNKLVVLFAILFFVLRLDLDSNVMVKFLVDEGVPI